MSSPTLTYLGAMCTFFLTVIPLAMILRILDMATFTWGLVIEMVPFVHVIPVVLLPIFDLLVTLVKLGTAAVAFVTYTGPDELIYHQEIIDLVIDPAAAIFTACTGPAIDMAELSEDSVSLTSDDTISIPDTSSTASSGEAPVIDMAFEFEVFGRECKYHLET